MSYRIRVDMHELTSRTMLGAMREADAFGHGTGVHGSYTPGDATPSLPASPDLPPQG